MLRLPCSLYCHFSMYLVVVTGGLLISKVLLGRRTRWSCHLAAPVSGSCNMSLPGDFPVHHNTTPSCTFLRSLDWVLPPPSSMETDCRITHIHPQALQIPGNGAGTRQGWGGVKLEPTA